jgi:hypothetical protein
MNTPESAVTCVEDSSFTCNAIYIHACIHTHTNHTWTHPKQHLSQRWHAMKTALLRAMQSIYIHAYTHTHIHTWTHPNQTQHPMKTAPSRYIHICIHTHTHTYKNTPELAVICVEDSSFTCNAIFEYSSRTRCSSKFDQLSTISWYYKVCMYVCMHACMQVMIFEYSSRMRCSSK